MWSSIGRSNIVGKIPLGDDPDAEANSCHISPRPATRQSRSSTAGLDDLPADHAPSRISLIVTPSGVARFVTGEMVKPGAAVIDVGIQLGC